MSSRLGLLTGAVAVHAGTDFWEEVVRRRTRGERVDYLICDEAQFYTAEQIEQLTRVVDEMDVDVFAFGITTVFRTRLFPGSQRLIELADRVQVPQVEALCWCGRRATHNARTRDGVMTVEGDQVVVGDVAMPETVPEAGAALVVGYETLCRRHYMRRITAHSTNLMAERDQLLPFELDACAPPHHDSRRPQGLVLRRWGCFGPRISALRG